MVSVVRALEQSPNVLLDGGYAANQLACSPSLATGFRTLKGGNLSTPFKRLRTAWGDDVTGQEDKSLE